MSHRILAFAVLFSFLAVGAVDAVAQLKTEEKIERDLRRISERLRCPVCQSENIYDSKAPLANEMRSIIREKLGEGRSEEEIVSFFVDRYGSFVLQEPPKAGAQILLWIGPFLIALLSAGALTWHLRRSDLQGADDDADALSQNSKGHSS